MHVKNTRAMAGTALVAALSVILLLLGTFVPVNTLFFTAMAAYLIGYSIGKYGLKYGFVQLIVSVLLDLFLNPDKLHWILYLCLGGYIFFCEVVFAKWNRAEEGKRKQRVQLICNWVIFQVIYVPFLFCIHHFFPVENIPGGTPVLWLAGQIGWLIYDKAYRVFIGMLRTRGM